MILRKTVLAALLCTPMGAMAATAGGAGHVDIYWVNSNLEAEGGFDEDGDGFGVKGMARISDMAFLDAEYQWVEFDGPGDPELDQLRAGIGFDFLRQQNMDLYGKLELVHLDSGDEDDTGYGAHVGAMVKPAQMQGLSLKAQIGWVDVDDLDGPEYLLGAAFNFTPQIGAFVDYRFSDFEDDAGDVELSDWRIGGRFNF